MNLRAVQVEMQRYLLGQDSAIERAVIGDERFPVRERLGVYSHAYGARLVEAMRQHYPALAQVLGDEQFSSLASDYVAAHPSRSPSIRYAGGRLADFLDDRVTQESDTMLADLARWEWALAAAFDGPDAQSLSIESFGNVPATSWPELRFGIAGSLQLVTLRSNALAWWRFAVQDGPQPAIACATDTTAWVIWRTGLATSFRSLPHDEARMLDGALRGRPFAELCAELEVVTDGHDAALRAATHMKTWLSAGWITSLTLRV